MPKTDELKTSSINDVLRALRILKGFTLVQVADKLDMQVNQIGGWERGERNIKLNGLKKLLDLYDYELIIRPKHNEEKVKEGKHYE